MATKAVEEFRAQQQSGDDASAYQAVDQTFRDASSEADLVQLNNIERAIVAACGDAPSQSTGWNVTNSTNGTFVNLTYQRTCQTGPFIETFVVKVTNGVARVAGYHMDGAALMPLLAAGAQPQPAAPGPTPAPGSNGETPPAGLGQAPATTTTTTATTTTSP